jgi:hypothetical protein
MSSTRKTTRLEKKREKNLEWRHIFQDLDLLKTFENTTMSPRIIDIAIMSCNMEALKWLNEHGKLICTKNCIRQVARMGRIGSIKYFLEESKDITRRQLEEYKKEACIGAAQKNREILLYYLKFEIKNFT